MAANKTTLNDGDVTAFLNTVEKHEKREDCFAILAMMEELVGAPAKMWGTSIIGFGSYDYKYASGRAGTWFQCGFSPRKANITLYIMAGFDEYEDLMSKLGKFKTGKSCLYIKKLTDVDETVLRELIKKSAAHVATGNTSVMG